VFFASVNVDTPFARHASSCGQTRSRRPYLLRVREVILYRRFLLHAITLRAVAQALEGVGGCAIVGTIRDSTIVECSAKVAVRIARQGAEHVRAAIREAFGADFPLVLTTSTGVSLGNLRQLEDIRTGERIETLADYYVVKQKAGDRELGDVVARSEFTADELARYIRDGIIEATTRTPEPERYPAIRS
jgi:hypothetical protein